MNRSQNRSLMILSDANGLNMIHINAALGQPTDSEARFSMVSLSEAVMATFHSDFQVSYKGKPQSTSIAMPISNLL